MHSPVGDSLNLPANQASARSQCTLSHGRLLHPPEGSTLPRSEPEPPTTPVRAPSARTSNRSWSQCRKPARPNHGASAPTAPGRPAELTTRPPPPLQPSPRRGGGRGWGGRPGEVTSHSYSSPCTYVRSSVR